MLITPARALCLWAVAATLQAVQPAGADGYHDTGLPASELLAMRSMLAGLGLGRVAHDMPCVAEGVQCEGGHVVRLSLRKAALGGSVPPEIRFLDRLQSLDLAFNQLNGSIPEWIGELRQLRKLNLAHNEFSGSIPATLGLLAELHSLALSNNALQGALPPQLGHLGKLEKLFLGGNRLVGVIPQRLADSPSLKRAMWRESPMRGSRGVDDHDNRFACPRLSQQNARILNAGADCALLE